MTTGTVELMNRGMRCLMDNLGTIEAERFISAVLRERFDYTQWQREYYDAIPPDKLLADVVAWARENPGIETRYVPRDVEETAQ